MVQNVRHSRSRWRAARELEIIYQKDAPNVLPVVIGVVILILLTATATRYSKFVSRLDDFDRVGAYVLFIVVGLPMIIVGLALIARYVVGGT